MLIFKKQFLEKLFSLILIPILLLGFFVVPVQAEWADHLVISAVQITEGEGKTNHDFIEIYNPTSSDINLKGYRLVKRTKIGTSDTSIKSWTDDAVIKAHGWRLWASRDDEAYSLTTGADDVTKQTVAPDNGIAIRLGAEDTGEIIDSVAWGAAENIFKEGNIPNNPGIGESLVRKPGISGAGNGEDTNNNSIDFNIVIGFTPHDSQSPAEPSIENSPEVSPSTSPATSPFVSPVPEELTNTSSSPADAPVAEAGADKEATVGEIIDFDGSDSYDPAGKDLSYNWDFGDGKSAKGETAAHSYSLAGEYKVVLKVGNNQNSSEDFLKVKINAPEFSDKIILSELLPNPLGADKEGEFIKLFNGDEKRINLKGWILSSGVGANAKRFQFSSDSYIEPKNYLTIKRSRSGLVLPNESGEASLIWPPEKIMSKVSYGAAKDGQSYVFKYNKWQWTGSSAVAKENTIKTANANSSAKKETNISNIENLDNDVDAALAAEENSDNEDNAANLILSQTQKSKNGSAQLLVNFDLESYLDSLVAKKVDEAILKSGTKDKDSASAENNSASGLGAEKANAAGLDSSTDTSGQGNIRNNPWFYGDILLSVLSLLLVWRYQEVRKRLK